MIILGIETSCDDTAAAVVEDGRKILSNVVASSIDMHVKTGGIIPESAAREQLKAMMPVISEAIYIASENSKSQTSNYKNIQNYKYLNHKWIKDNLDAIAVTVGPGLIGSLLVGVETARTLSYLWNKPVIPVNHMHGHLYAAWLAPSENPKQIQKIKYSNSAKDYKAPKFPLVALIVSGGHTDLIYIPSPPERSPGKDFIKYLGGTRDDAAGEAFDKTARIIGLPYPGGPEIAACAAKFEALNPMLETKLFPRPMMNNDNYEFSFSGLKTAVLNYTKQNVDFDVNQMAAEIQAAIIETLVTKTARAIDEYKPKSLIVSGGVAANLDLRESFAREISARGCNIHLHVPVAQLCTDNAAMIAAAGYYNNKLVSWQEINVNPELTIID